MRAALIALLASGVLAAQYLPTGMHAVTGSVAITLDASCTGSSSSATVAACSGAMTVTAGDTITCEAYTNNGSFDPTNLIINDPTNGWYKGVTGYNHTSNADYWIGTAVFENSASGSIAPQVWNWEATGMGIACQAWKGTPSAATLDGGGVNLTKSATAANPTSGTAAAPTNANEVVICQMVRAAAASTTGGAGFSPGGTLTGITQTISEYFQYQIQTTATAVNCPYTSASAGYRDTQFALLNASSSGGYNGLTGFFGVPLSAQTNGASATTAILNGATGSISTLSLNPGWFLLAGAATTFDTGVAPLGTQKFVLNGLAHTIGDAATSIKVPAANTTTAYDWTPEGFINNGNGVWLGSWMRMGTNATTGTNCDTWNLDGTVVEGNFTTQVYYDSTNKINFQFERAQGNTPTITGMIPSPTLNLAQDYYIITHVAGVNEANDELFVLGEATQGTLPWVVLDHFTAPKGGQVIATTTATAGSGASTITVASGTGIVVGQSVFSATTSVDTGQITHGTVVTSVAGTSIGISIPTTASMSATPVEFAGPVASTTGSVTAGSTTLTVTSGTGLVAGVSGTGQVVGMAGVQAGTYLSGGSGTSWTLSQPATTTQTSVAVQLWTPFGGTYGVHFGKFSSCTSTADMWFSGFIFEPYGGILSQIASGALGL